MNGDAKVPRIAIRMDGKNKIGEIRGISGKQNMEPEMMPKIVNTKIRLIKVNGDIEPIYRVIIGEITRWISPGSKLKIFNIVTCEIFIADISVLITSSRGKMENSR